MQRACRAIAWLLALVIVVLSVVPPSDRPVTGVPHNFEHLGIFLAAGLAFAAGYRDRLLTVAAGLLLFCGLIEMVQLWVPGRHARLVDLVVDAVAVCIGVGFYVVGKWTLPRRLKRWPH